MHVSMQYYIDIYWRCIASWLPTSLWAGPPCALTALLTSQGVLEVLGLGCYQQIFSLLWVVWWSLSGRRCLPTLYTDTIRSHQTAVCGLFEDQMDTSGSFLCSLSTSYKNFVEGPTVGLLGEAALLGERCYRLEGVVGLQKGFSRCQVPE